MWHIFTANQNLVLVLLLGWFFSIFVLSSVPGDRYPKVDFPLADKCMHVQLYFWGGLLAAAYYKKSNFWIPLGLIVFYGMTDEVHQLFVPNRTFSLEDWLADIVGAGLGVAVSRQLQLAGVKVLSSCPQDFDSQIMES